VRLVFVLLKEGTALQFADDRHAADEVMERYSMDRLAGQELAEFEEHLLVCEPCQDRLAREDSIRCRVRDGAAILLPRRAEVLWQWPKWQRLVWALGLVAAGVLIFAGSQWQSLRPFAAPRAVILLRATRGTENPTLAAAPTDRAFILMLDLSGLQPFSEYGIEIVDSAGKSAFQSKARPQNDRLQTILTRGLPAGTYFVRLYSPALELLREYPLIVRGV